MRCTILKRILDGQKTVGFQVLSEDGKVLNINKNQTLQAAAQGLITNATYNKHTKSISGRSGSDLRSIPSIQAAEITSQKSETRQNNSNHAMARKYNENQANKQISFTLLPNDRVRLDRINPNITDKVVIPSFITDIKFSINKFRYSNGEEYNLGEEISEWLFEFRDESCEDVYSILIEASKSGAGYGPSVGCKYTQLYIDNKPNVPFNSDGLCIGLASRSLEVGFAHPECVTGLTYAFAQCINLEKLDIAGVEKLKNNKSLEGLLVTDYRLKSTNIMNIPFDNVENMDYMYFGCSGLTQPLRFNANTKSLLSMRGAFGYSGFRNITFNCIDTSRVKDFTDTFFGCHAEFVDVSKFDISSATSLSCMFTHAVGDPCEKHRVIGAEHLDFNPAYHRIENNADRMFSEVWVDKVIIPKDITMLSLLHDDFTITSYPGYIDTLEVRADTLANLFKLDPNRDKSFLGFKLDEGGPDYCSPGKYNLIGKLVITDNGVMDNSVYSAIADNIEHLIKSAVAVGITSIYLPCEIMNNISSRRLKSIQGDNLTIIIGSSFGNSANLQTLSNDLDFSSLGLCIVLFDTAINSYVALNLSGNKRFYMTKDDVVELLNVGLALNADAVAISLENNDESLAVSNVRSKNAKELIEIASRGLNDAAANRIKDLALRDIKASRYDEIAYIISRLKQGESQVLTIGGKKIQLTSI